MKVDFLILGATGQDGTLFRELLLQKGKSYSIVSRKSYLEDDYSKKIYYGDLKDKQFVRVLLQDGVYKYIINFANDSFVQNSEGVQDIFDRIQIFRNLVEVIDGLDYNPTLLHPLSSEIFGTPDRAPQDLNTTVKPINVYGTSKSLEFLICEHLHNNSDFNIFYPILYNHESSLRNTKFFSAKIINALRDYKRGKGKTCYFFNSKSKRDWGYAKDYQVVLYELLTSGYTGLEIIGSGCQMTVEEFIDFVLKNAGVSFVKKYVNGNLEYIDSSEFRLFVEKGGDNVDASRDFCADTTSVALKLEDFKILGGEGLIKQLLIDFDARN